MKLDEFVAECVKDLKSLDRFAAYVRRSGMEVMDYSYDVMADLPIDEFRRRYMVLMESHRYTDGWWENEIPCCEGCREEIKGPEDLRMLESRPYHPTCLRQAVDMDRYEDSRFRGYLEKVLAMDEEQ